MKKYASLILISLLATGCSSIQKINHVVKAKVISSQQYCGSKSADSTDVLLHAAGGGLIGSQLGGGKMKYVNGFIGTVVGAEYAKSKANGKTECKFINVLEYENPYDRVKMTKSFRTNHQLKVGSRILFETSFNKPY